MLQEQIRLTLSASSSTISVCRFCDVTEQETTRSVRRDRHTRDIKMRMELGTRS